MNNYFFKINILLLLLIIKTAASQTIHNITLQTGQANAVSNNGAIIGTIYNPLTAPSSASYPTLPTYSPVLRNGHTYIIKNGLYNSTLNTYPAVEYWISPLFLHKLEGLANDPIVIVVEPGVTLRTPYSTTDYDVLFWISSSNYINVIGTGATMQMIRPTGSNSAAIFSTQSAVRIENTHEVKVSGFSIKDATDDGIYLAEGAEDVLLENIWVDHSHRNGMSIITAKNLTVSNCWFTGSSGENNTEWGLDIEPNARTANKILDNIVFSNCRFTDNNANGISVSISAHDYTTPQPVDITFNDCYVGHNCLNSNQYSINPSEIEIRGLRMNGGLSVPEDVTGNIKFNRCMVENSSNEAVRIAKRNPATINNHVVGFNLEFNACVFKNVAQQKPSAFIFEALNDYEFPVGTMNPSDAGGTTFTDCMLSYSSNVQIAGDAANKYLELGPIYTLNSTGSIINLTQGNFKAINFNTTSTGIGIPNFTIINPLATAAVNPSLADIYEYHFVNNISATSICNGCALAVAGSIITSPPACSLTLNPMPDLIEDCSPAIAQNSAINLTTNLYTEYPQAVSYAVTGDGEQGFDYQLTKGFELFLPHQQSITDVIAPISNGINELLKLNYFDLTILPPTTCTNCPILYDNTAPVKQYMVVKDCSNSSCFNNLPAITITTASSTINNHSSNMANNLTGQTLLVYDELVIDANTVLDNCEVFLLYNAKINIAPGFNLTTQGNTILHGCGAMWQGVLDSSSGTSLSATNSTFMDAVQAITAKDGATLNADGNTFENNFSGIGLYNYNSAPVAVTNNTFIATAPLTKFGANKLPYPVPTYGVFAQSIKNLSIGSSITNGNVFDNTIYGIYATNTNLAAYNNTFSHHVYLNTLDAQWPFYEGAGIKIVSGTEGDNLLATSSQLIGGNGANEKNTFTDCYIGVDIAKSADINIVNNEFNEIHNVAINVINPFTRISTTEVSPFNSAYHPNNINYNVMQKVANGIRVNSLPSGAYLNILHNHIDADVSYAHIAPGSPSQFSPPTSTGIRVSGLSSVPNQYRVNIEYSDINKTHTGIEVRNINAPFIFYNAIEAKGSNVTYTLPIPPFTGSTFINTGISVANCPFNRIAENSIDGQFNTNMLTKGIYISNSHYSKPYCNVTSKTGNGIEFYLDEQGAQLRNNLFQECKNGFVLNSGMMSDQGSTTIANFNKWVNNTVPVNMQLWKPVPNSLPKIYFYCDNSSSIYQPVLPYFNPLDFTPSTIDDPMPDACANIGGGGGGGNNSIAENILNGDWVIDGYETSTDEIAKIHLYTFLMASDEDLENDASLINRRDDLLSQRDIQQFLLDFEASDLGDLNNVNLQLEQGNITQAALSNAAISSTDGYVIKARKYYDLYIHYLKNEDILTDSLYDAEVLSIAKSCPLEYGNTVYLAQALYHLINPYALFQDDDQCNIQAARKANPVKPKGKIKKTMPSFNTVNLLSVSPNPSNGNFTIHSIAIENNAIVEILNNIGQVVYKSTTANFSQGDCVINLSNIIDGLYFLRVSTIENTYSRTLVLKKE